MRYNNIKQIFNVTENKFLDKGLCYEESTLWYKELIGKGENAKLYRKGLRIYKKLIFKQICVHIYWFEDKYIFDKKKYSTGIGGEDYIFKASLIKLSETQHFYYLNCILDNSFPDFICSWHEFYKL